MFIEAVLKSKFKNHSNYEIITDISKWLTGAKGRILKNKIINLYFNICLFL